MMASREPRSPRGYAVFGTVLAIAASLSSCTQPTGATPAFTRITPQGLADSQALWNYSQVIVTAPGAKLIEVAGTTGDDASGNIIHPGDFARQVDRTFDNLAASLRAAGASTRDVIRVRMHVVGLDGERHWPIINAAMKRHFGNQGPTATMVGIQALAASDILFEIDATAALPGDHAGGA